MQDRDVGETETEGTVAQRNERERERKNANFSGRRVCVLVSRESENEERKIYFSFEVFS